MTDPGKTEMVEYWVLGDWQVTQWRYNDNGRFDDEWFTINRTTETADPDDAHYSSLYETLPAVAALAYVGDGVEDEDDAHWLAMLFARQIGMDRWNGQEWAHTVPDVTW